MLLAIDTDLFKSAISVKNDKRSQRAIEWLVENIETLNFALDKKKVMLREYHDFLGEFSDAEELPVRFLSDLLENRLGTQTRLLQSDCPHDIQEMVNKWCNEPVEPTLIGMGCYAKKLGYVILLNQKGERKRGLRDQSIRSQVCKQLSIRVEIPDTKISFPALEKESKTERDIWFEDKCREALREIYGFRYSEIRTPQIIENVVGDIDVYGYNLEGNPRQVWIGECKLRRFNENNFVEINKVEQLVNKLPAIQQYEASRSNVKDGPIQIKAFVASNANDMRSEAWELLASISGTFFRVHLTDSWREDIYWRITKLEEFEPYQDKSGQWNGRLIGVFPLRKTEIR